MHARLFTQVSNNLQPFNPEEYYINFKSGVLLKKKGVLLLVDYLNHKYQANIKTAPSIMEIIDELAEHRKANPDFRVGYVNGLIGHGTPVIYIKEGDQEGILIADSLGGTSFVKHLAAHFGIPVYTVEEPQQSDKVSCFTYSLVMTRDTTARQADGNYRIPKLLQLIKARATKFEENCWKVMLPDELLKAAQLPNFISQHNEYSGRKIHKNEDLNAFRQRYSISNQNSYLFVKGTKYMNVIERQFYLNQFKQCDHFNLQNSHIKKFNTETKKNWRSAENEHEFLYQFSLKFLENCEQETLINKFAQM